MCCSPVRKPSSTMSRPFRSTRCRRRRCACSGYSRSEEHTSELQSLMRISYAVFCLKKKKRQKKDEEPLNTIRSHLTSINRHATTSTSHTSNKKTSYNITVSHYTDIETQ